MVVVVDLVVAERAVLADLAGVVGQHEGEQAGGVVVGLVFFDQCLDGVFDFKASDVGKDLVAAHCRALALTDVDASIADVAGDAVFDQDVLGLDGVEAIAAGVVHL